MALPLPTQEARALTQLNKDFLVRLQEYRKTPANTYDVVGIINFMHGLVEEERMKMGKTAGVQTSAIRRADSCASGHVDYELKMAHYCAELVYQEEIYA